LLLLQQAAVPCCFHSRRTVFCNSSSCCPDSSKRRETEILPSITALAAAILLLLQQTPNSVSWVPDSYSNRRQPCQSGPSLRDQGLVSFGDVTCQSFALTTDHLFLHDRFLHLLHQALEAEQRHAECARPLLPKVVPLRTHACARFRTCARFRNDVQASFSVQITLAACIGLLGREGGPYKRRVVFACGPFL
jgi:hypothetical protein